MRRGVGGVSHRKFFSLLFIAFSLFVFLWYSLNTNFVPFFASLAETPKVKSTPTGRLAHTPRFPPLASFLTFTACSISVFRQVCLRGWDFGESDQSLDRIFLFQFWLHSLTVSVVPYLPADTSKGLHLFDELGIRTFSRTHGPRKSFREGAPPDCWWGWYSVNSA